MASDTPISRAARLIGYTTIFALAAWKVDWGPGGHFEETFDVSRLNPNRETVLLVVHQASRTGAPILAYNIALRLRQRYNVVAPLLAGGELTKDFRDCCAAVIGPLTYADWNPLEMDRIARRILASCRVSYAIVNSIECRLILEPLAAAKVPVVTLVHEFSSTVNPPGRNGARPRMADAGGVFRGNRRRIGAS